VKKLNRRGILRLAGLLVFMAQLGLPQTNSKMPTQGKPPRNLTQQPDGHWSANKLEEGPEGVEVHTVRAGDTLWDVTQRYLKDAYLWPQVWEINSKITNPHWIYPGDKIIIKKMVVVDTAAETTPSEPEDRQETPVSTSAAPKVEVPSDLEVQTPAADPKPPVPAASYTDIYCAGFFSANEIKPGMIIVGGEESEHKNLFSERDIIYINQGASAGIKPGDEFLVVRRAEDFARYGARFASARSHSKYGFYYKDLGRVRILLAQENSATAEIVFACEEINARDLLIPNEQRASAGQRPETVFDKFAPPNNKTTGQIFMTKEYRVLVGKGQVVYIDVGRKDNVQVGDYLRITRHFNSSNVSIFNKSNYQRYRRTFDSVRKIIGELVVLRVEPNTSTALVTLSTQDITLGDGVERE
jgi:LysM domain